MDVPLPELNALALRFAGERHDAYSERALARAHEEFLSRRRPRLAPFSLRADGREYPHFYALLADEDARFEEGELRLHAPPGAGPAWEFLRPFERIVVHSDGSAELGPTSEGPTERAILRVLLREHYLPRSRVEEDRAATGGERVELGGFVGTLAQGIGACRERALLPFSVALLLYLPEERIRLELDLPRSDLLVDPRAGRLSAARRVRRTSRFSWAVDRAVGRGDLTLLMARCLEVVSESSGLNAVELTHVFGGVRELVDSALQGLVARGWTVFDHRLGVYRPRPEAFLPSSGAPTLHSDRAEPMPDPALRTSVQELLAAADARATCPLCGNPLPSGPREILCASCAAKVGAP